MFDERIDFIGLGVQKSATSWIFQCLLEHPEIRIGEHKEVHFFNLRFQRGYAWYHGQFEFGHWKTGEFSTLYFPDAEVPRRIHDYNPGVKLLLSLRNPVDRAYSQHIHNIREGRVPAELLEFGDAWPLNPGYIEQGYYATHLKRFLEYFPKEQIHIVFFDDVKSEPDRVMAGMYSFLGVDPSFRPGAMGKRINTARTYRSRLAHRLFMSAETTVKQVLPLVAVEQVKKLGLQNLYSRWNEKPADAVRVPPLRDEVRNELTERFSGEIKELAQMLGRDLSTWLTPTPK